MAWPSPMYVLLKGGTYLTLEDVIAETREDILNTDQTNYRDTMDAAFQGNNIQLQVVAAGSSSFSANGDRVPLIGSLTAQTDEFTHTIPRNTFSKRTMIRWWQAGGASLIFSGDIASGSAAVVVASINGLYQGMAVSGAGIAAGTIIQELRTIPTITGTLSAPVYNVILSQVASATTLDLAITATSPVGDLAGECWADRFIGWSGAAPTR